MAQVPGSRVGVAAVTFTLSTASIKLIGVKEELV